MENLKFCYEKNIANVKNSLKNIRTSKAVWQKSKYWNKGKTIRVYFINGTVEEQTEMRKALSEIAYWTELGFVYTTDRDNSEIRISFNKGWGSYSYLGTDALLIPKTMETMNIGWRGLDVCRHEALHAIGALHEHQNPKNGIEWDEEAVIRDLSGAPNYWTEEEIRYNVLNKLDATKVDASDFDPDSIMLYYFPSSWTKNGVSSNDNTAFSNTDVQFMQSIYKIQEEDTIAPQITLIGDSTITLDVDAEYEELGAIATDNKDGIITDNIKIEGSVDTSKVGLHHIVYSVEDAAGNKSEKIRTIMIQTNLELKVFLRELFPTKYRLSQLIEPQLITLAQSLDIDASVDDLKATTLDKVWESIK